MNPAPATSTLKPATPFFSQALIDEAHELEELHVGLRNHLASWREANESAIMQLGATMARIDALLERIERLRT